MHQMDYRAFYEQAGSLNGWNFSRLQVVEEGVRWDFFEEAAKRCTTSDLLLDIGTGGGERLLAASACALLAIGIDHSEAMIRTAAANLAASPASNVRFMRMEAEKLDFPDHFFNVITCRQSEFYAEEVRRVLVHGGVFLTQQVSEGDKSNIRHAFQERRAFGEKPDGTLQGRCLTELGEAGFTDLRCFEYDAEEYYGSVEDLIFLLKHTPIVPGFGEEESDFEILRKFVEQNRCEKGIRTNSKRFLIIAR